jgi:crotonobetainyl-CoA:carnitine CoA-transferase CaiB-like acyl-CoA transferase
MNELVSYVGRTPPPVGHPGLRGLTSLQSYYEVADGWIYIDSAMVGDADAAVAKLRAAGILRDATTDDDALATELTASLRTLKAQDAVARVEEAGLRAARARFVSEVLQDPILLNEEAFHIRTSDDHGTFMTPGRYAGFSRTQRRGPLSPAGIGEHTIAVLEEAGFPREEIDQLMAADVVRAGSRVQHVLPISYR